jgi:nucleoside-diphosphate-sugar epimerase
MILVTGATGNVGRELVKLLLDSGEEVGAVTRDPGSAAVPAGARVVGDDPSRPATLTSARCAMSRRCCSARAPSVMAPLSSCRWRASTARAGLSCYRQ